MSCLLQVEFAEMKLKLETTENELTRKLEGAEMLIHDLQAQNIALTNWMEDRQMDCN